MAPSPYQVVGRGLAGGIRRVRPVGRFLREAPGFTEGAVNLIGRNVVETEALPRPILEFAPIGARRLEQRIGADDVGLDEGGRAVDRPVDVGFGGQMHHRTGPVLGEDAPQRGTVTDIDFLEGIAPIGLDVRERAWRRRVGELVDIDDLGVGLADEEADEGRADEARAAGDQNLQDHTPHNAAANRLSAPIRHTGAEHRHQPLTIGL